MHKPTEKKKRSLTSNNLVGALDGVRIQVLFARLGLGHEWGCKIHKE